MKKSISIVIALMLLVNVFAFSAFAAVPSGNAIALTLSAEDKAYAAGETVMVTLSIETTSAVSGLYAGEIEVAYDSSIFEPASDLSSGPLLANYGCTEGTIINGNHEVSLSSVKSGGDAGFFDEDVDAYNWDAGLYFGIVENSAGFTPVDCSTGPQTFITFPLKLKAGVADGSYTIGVNKCAFEGDNAVAFITDEEFGGIFGGMGADFGVGDNDTFACGTLTITVGQGGGSTGPTEPTVTVTTLPAQVQWANKDAGLMNLGFRGQIKGYDAEADKDGTNKGPNGGAQLKTLTEVGIYLNDTKYPAYTIYNFVDGGYFYRVVVGNVSYDATKEFSAKAYVVIGGQTLNAENTITTTGKAQYERAILVNGFGAK